MVLWDFWPGMELGEVWNGFRTVESKPGLMALAPARPEVASLCQQSMTFPQHQDKALFQGLPYVACVLGVVSIGLFLL